MAEMNAIIDKVPDELLLLVLEDIRNGKAANLKACCLVCRRFNEIAKPLFFRHVVLWSEGCFKRLEVIFQEKDIRQLVRAITIDQSGGLRRSMAQLDSFILKSLEAWLVHLASKGIVYMLQEDSKWVVTLPDCEGSAHLPALQDIQIIASEPPYSTMSTFRGLERLHIRAQTVQLPQTSTWDSLVDLHLTFHTLEVESFKKFMENHKRLQSVRLHAIATLEPLRDSVVDRIRSRLCPRLATEQVDALLHAARQHANGKALVFIHNVYEGLEDILDEEVRGDPLVDEFLEGFKEVYIRDFKATLGQQPHDVVIDVSAQWATEE